MFSTFPPRIRPIPPARSTAFGSICSPFSNGRPSRQGKPGGSNFAFEIYREAQYVMAALADEIFLHMNWDGRANWPLLESKLFQTHIAGEVIFQRLDRLLQRRDPFYLDLAAVYFMALSLGFQGKYRGNDPANALEQYKRQLFAMIYRRNPQLFNTKNPIFPQTYQNTLDRGAGRKLPNQNIWFGLESRAVFVVWLGVSHFAWSSVSGRVSCLICRVNNGNCVCPVGTPKMSFDFLSQIGSAGLAVRRPGSSAHRQFWFSFFFPGMVKNSGGARRTASASTECSLLTRSRRLRSRRSLQPLAARGGNLPLASFARTMAFLKNTVTGRDYRYQIPWFLVIGEPGSGKKSVSPGSDRRQSLLRKKAAARPVPVAHWNGVSSTRAFSSASQEITSRPAKGRLAMNTVGRAYFACSKITARGVPSTV